MQIIRDLSFWPETAHGSVMALGNFDGVHAGHRTVICHARDLAHTQKRSLAVMAFEPHPRRFFKPDLPILRITPFSEKARLLRELGVDYFYVARFNQAFSSISAESFVADILLDGLRIHHVVTGPNFAFGHKRQGDSAFLTARADEYGFGYSEVEILSGPEGIYSSSAIRNALSEGNILKANAMLGRKYSMRGTIIHGDKRGRTIGFPTANICPAPLFLPRMGVYAVRLLTQDHTYSAIANLGVRPTFGLNKPLLEVHVLNENIDLYGQKVKVEFLAFIRPEQKFDGLEVLKAQIAEDIRKTELIHAEMQEKTL